MIVGVIGGCGVAATNKLCELIETSCTRNGAYRDYHHPEMIIYQATQAPSRSMYLEGRGPSFIDDYVAVGKKLKDSGAGVLCMCCNTAHYALPILRERIGVPFIDMIEEVVVKCRQTGKTRFGIAAAEGCLRGKVYETGFAKLFPEAELIYPDEHYQELVTRAICNVKNKHRFDSAASEERPQHLMEVVAEHLMGRGAEVVVVGCTDLRVDYIPSKDNVVDSLETLASKIIETNQNAVHNKNSA